MTDENALARARSIALTILERYSQPVPEDLEAAIDAAVGVEETLGGPSVDRNRLLRLLEAEVSIFVEPAAILQDSDEAHAPWLDERRGEIKWNFRDGYLDLLRRRHPREVVRTLDRMTDEILDLLVDPMKEGTWDRRGMIVGEVQSGKTSNYTGLICKAADSGYKFIVVLAGVHNSLRSQTQHRLDEGFLGFESVATVHHGQRNRIGVGAGGRSTPPVVTLTSSAEDGDFRSDRAKNLAARIGGDPFLLVVKKNTRVLDNLIQWITSVHGVKQPGSADRIVQDLPILVIDDEADHASINTNRTGSTSGGNNDETDPTAVNRKIRLLLKSFSRSSFVSYTATPFANIFIGEDSAEGKFGEDLFPRSFILRMKAPSDHTGPRELFGIASADRASENDEGLPVIRPISDQALWLQPKHKSTASVGPIPESLVCAVRSFILSTAARRVRGQRDVHNSMLVHVTRYTDVQRQVAEQILDLVDSLRDKLEGYAGEHILSEILSEFRTQWSDDFEVTSNKMGVEDIPTWEAVAAEIPGVVGRIKVLEINGTQRDTLTYARSVSTCVIAVGGDKLSRGLTLEGLTVSYYLRASRMYDTLLQMGRWFGYRTGYLDLTRLYTSREIHSAFRQITVANEELSAKFDDMSRVGSNPRDFSLYVRRNDNLLITAPGKMRNGVSLELSFAGKIVETIGFSGEAEQKANLRAVRALLADSAKYEVGSVREHLVLHPVPGERVAGFLDSFTTVEGATKARSRQISDYIRGQMPRGELTMWTVAAISNSKAKEGHRIDMDGRSFGLSRRRDESIDDRESSPSALMEGQYAIKRLVSPTDELIDLDADELHEASSALRRAQALETARAEGMGADPAKIRRLSLAPFARRVRPPTRGLLLLYLLDPENTWMADKIEAIPGFAISFPVSETAESVRYAVPARYREMID